jgi:signal transduction histidine kinase
VRRLATQLRPSILDDLGLIAAMEWQSEEFQKRSEIKTIFKSNTYDIDISPELATGFFRIFQESLTNVLRHSKATKVEAMLNLKDGLLILNITDNGIGFKAKEIESKKTLGLLGMKERTLIMGGSYEITSKQGKGTTVVIIVPIQNKV